eukprot:6374365-Lingulodinium_polyedra.AAC.1
MTVRSNFSMSSIPASRPWSTTGIWSVKELRPWSSGRWFALRISACSSTVPPPAARLCRHTGCKK